MLEIFSFIFLFSGPLLSSSRDSISVQSVGFSLFPFLLNGTRKKRRAFCLRLWYSSFSVCSSECHNECFLSTATTQPPLLLFQVVNIFLFLQDFLTWPPNVFLLASMNRQMVCNSLSSFILLFFFLLLFFSFHKHSILTQLEELRQGNLKEVYHLHRISGGQILMKSDKRWAACHGSKF